MRESLLRWVPGVVLLVGALGAWALARGPEEAPPDRLIPAAPEVRVELQAARVSVRTHGTVEPRTEIELVAKVTGRVRSVAPGWVAGGLFGAGAVLVEIDPEDARLVVERADASLARALSEAGRAESNLARLRTLSERKVASAARLEDATRDLEVAVAMAREARVIRDEARRDLRRTRIRAPFAGRVRVTSVEPGQFVARGTKLGLVYAVDAAEVRLPVPTSELAFLDLPLTTRIGAKNPPGALPDGPRVRLRARFAGRELEWLGRIVRTEGLIAERSRMLHVIARIEDPLGLQTTDDEAPPPLAMGLFVEAEIEGRRLDDLVTLPREALRGADQVLVLDADGHLRARKVEVLRVEEERVLISAGLARGERVAASSLAAPEGTLVREQPDEPEFCRIADGESCPHDPNRATAARSAAALPAVGLAP